MTLKNVFLFLIGLIVLASCSRNPLDVDASNVELELSFHNVDSVLYYSDAATLLTAHNEFKENLKEIYSFELGQALRIGNVEDSVFYNSIVLFRADTSIQSLEEYIQTGFDNKSDIEQTVTNGFKHLKYHFPNGKYPEDIVYLNTLFSAGVFCTEKEIGVGLERFLGDSCAFIKKLNAQYYFDWMKEAMDARYIERDILTGWIETHFVEGVNGNLAENIIRWGKILYLTEAAFPDINPAIILRYSDADFQWAEDNEEQFWTYLVKEKVLFKIDERTKRNMLSEGPFTPGLPNQEAPDRLGQYLGWKIVHKYIEKNDVTAADLIGIPYNEILQEYEID